MNFMLRIFCLILVVSFNSNVKSAESVHLDIVPIDISLNCFQVFLRSSMHFKNTVFFVPKVKPGNGVYSAIGSNVMKTININPSKDKGFYDLYVYLHFPDNNSEFDEVGKSHQLTEDLNKCNFSKIKAFLNKDITNVEEKITTVSYIPLTSIEMTIPGIQYKGRYGSSKTGKEPTVFNYYGQSVAIYFKISEEEYKSFSSQVLKSEGIEADVVLHFLARDRVGTVGVSVDKQKFIDEFQAQVNGSKLKYLSLLQIEAYLKQSAQKVQFHVKSEAGADGAKDDVSQITKQVIDNLISSFKASIEAEPDTTKSAKELSTDKIPVEVAISKISSQLSVNLNIEMFSKSIEAKIPNQLNLKVHRIEDTNSNDIDVTVGEMARFAGISIKKGETIMITPKYWYRNRYTYAHDNKRYLSKDEIVSLDLANKGFPSLSSPSVKLQDVNYNENIIGEGWWKPIELAGAKIVQYSLRWFRSTASVIKTRVDSDTLGKTFDKLIDLDVTISFSDIGGKQYKLSDLMQENSFWDVAFDENTGRLILKAKTDLGDVRFRSKYSKKDKELYKKRKLYVTENVVLDYVQEVVWDHWDVLDKQSSLKVLTQKALKQDEEAVTMQLSYVFNVSNPTIMSPREEANFKKLALYRKRILEKYSNYEYKIEMAHF